MNKNRRFFYIGVLILLLLLFLFPSESIRASRKGLLLWFNVIIPTLFPFMVISYILIHSPLSRALNRLGSMKMSTTIYSFIIGSLSGYPMGAITAAELVETGKISRQQGNYLLTFCNNPSPMFIVGYIGSELLGSPREGYFLLLSVHIGNLITALIFLIIHAMGTASAIELPTSIIPNKQKEKTLGRFDDLIHHTAEVLVKIGAIIILFSIPVEYLRRITPDHSLVLFLISLIDLSNGASILSESISVRSLQFTMLAALCSFGSVSVIFQTASIIKGARLSVYTYIRGKVLNLIITGLIASLISLSLFSVSSHL